MTYLLYYRSNDPHATIDEYIVLTLSPPKDHPHYQRLGYSLFATIEIDDDLYALPLDRELIER